MEKEDRRGRARRLKQRFIADTAVRLALDKGLDAATVEAISEAAAISSRTFFNYFATKEEALTLAPSVAAEDVEAFVVARPADERPVRTMRELAKQLAESFVPSRDQIELWRTHPELLARVQRGGKEQLFAVAMAAVAARRPGGDEVYPGVLVTTTFALVQWAVRASWEETAGRSVEEFIDAAFDLLERGL